MPLRTNGPHRFRRVSAKKVNCPSKEEGANVRDGSFSEKERPSRMKSSPSENERPTEMMIIPSTAVNGPSEEEVSKNRDGIFSEKGRPTRM
jgi:hypothetical protein